MYKNAEKSVKTRKIEKLVIQSKVKTKQTLNEKKKGEITIEKKITENTTTLNVQDQVVKPKEKRKLKLTHRHIVSSVEMI